MSILWWMLGFSYFIHLISILVSIWDRIRLKPSAIERFSEVVPWSQFNAFKKEVRDQFACVTTSRDFDKALTLLDDRFNGLHQSLREERNTTQQLIRDLMRDIGKLEGAKS